MSARSPILRALRTLHPSGDSRARDRRLRACPVAPRRPGRRPAQRERGVALIMALTAIAILSVLLADMHERTSTAYAVATARRDRLQAEYMAKSGLNLTRLLVHLQPRIRRMVVPLYQMQFQRPPPQLPIWRLANEILKPFCNWEQAKKDLSGAMSLDMKSVQGLEGIPGTCDITAFAENSKINVNSPLSFGGDRARRQIAERLFRLTEGGQPQSPYDPLFQDKGPSGNYTSRLDLISAVIDWWDVDTRRTVFEPGPPPRITSQGAEEDIYARYDDPYHAKNAPYDSLQELRLVRGVDADFWATFVQPDPNQPETRNITVYGSGSINPNEAPPGVLLAQVCSFLARSQSAQGTAASLCTPAGAQRFISLLTTVRQLAPGVPLFTRSRDFFNFLEGQGRIYPMLQSFLGEDSSLLFRPINIPNNIRGQLGGRFVTAARILTVRVTGRAGRSEVELHTVVNSDPEWNPPPPNAGQMPPLGVFHYYRMN